MIQFDNHNSSKVSHLLLFLDDKKSGVSKIPSAVPTKTKHLIILYSYTLFPLRQTMGMILEWDNYAKHLAPIFRAFGQFGFVSWP